jgi:hypothetical protein
MFLLSGERGTILRLALRIEALGERVRETIRKTGGCVSQDTDKYKQPGPFHERH